MKKIFTLVLVATSAISAMAVDYTEKIAVYLNGNQMGTPATTTVTVNKTDDGKYSLQLKNFVLMGGAIKVGNINLTGVNGTECGIVTAISSQQTIKIENGDEGSGWQDPLLGDVPVMMDGQIRNGRLNAVLSIDMAAMGQMVLVELGDKAAEIGQIPNSGFEDFHKAKYVSMDGANEAESDEPNGWHAFNSGYINTADPMAALYETALYSKDTHISDEVRPGSTGKKSVQITSDMVLGFVAANGTMTTGRLQAGSYTPTDAANCSFLDMSKTDVDGNGDPFYTVLTSKPDSIAVWVKFKQGTLADENKDYKFATVSAIITDGTYYQDPQDKDDYKNVVAKAQNKEIESKDFAWQRISVPFDYATYAADDAEAKALLVTLSTNAQPGVGSTDATNPDQLFVDDIQLVYNAGLASLKVKGQNVELNGGSDYTVEGVSGELSANDIEVASDGQGAYITKTLTQNGSDVNVRIAITSNDLRTTNVYNLTVKGTTVTGINNPVSTANGKAVAVFTIDGKRVTGMNTKGLYIVRYADGKTVKVVKK